MKFNKKQELAIHFGLGAYAIIAGAGSGKSTVLTYRTQYLVNELGIDEEDILILSFTSNAKENMISKLKEIGIKNVQVHTFHSQCMKIMINEGYNCDIIEDKDKYKITNLFRQYNKKLTNGEISNIFSFIGYQKQYGIKYNEIFVPYEMMASENDIRECFRIYEQYKQDNNKTDYEDWINITTKILESNPSKYTYKFLMCDEHQDTNLIQNKLINLLCPSHNIMCVFDYRQSIFGFSGANPEYCMNFENDYNNSTIINLDINYRSCKNIVEYANSFIKPYYSDYKYYSDAQFNNKNNGIIEKLTTYSRDEESDVILEKVKGLIQNGENPNDIAILYRLSSNSDNLVKKFKDNKIKFDIKNNSSFFKKKEINFVLSILKLINDTSDDEAFENTYKSRGTDLKFLTKKEFENIKLYSDRYNLGLFQSLTAMKFYPDYKQRSVKRFINNIEKLRLQKDRNINLKDMLDNIYSLFDTDDFIKVNWESTQHIEHQESLETLKSFAKGKNISSFIKFANGESKTYNEENKDGIKMMTIHKSKGLEFKHVFIIGVEDGKFPHEKSSLLEEARLMYVAITRAKENLTISQIYEGNQFVEEYFN